MTQASPTLTAGLSAVATDEVSCGDLQACFERGRRRGAAMYRRTSTDGMTVELLGLGIARSFAGDARHGSSAPMTSAFSRFLGAISELDEDATKALRVLGWSAFDPAYATHEADEMPSWEGFPRHALYVPEVLIIKSEEGTRAVVAATQESTDAVWRRWRSIVAPSKARADAASGDRDAHIRWLDGERFRRGVATVIDDELAHKVVLARRALMVAQEPIDICAAMAVLDAQYPSCTLFAIAPKEGAPVFAGATPEPLVCVDNRRLKTVALAGTTRGSEQGAAARQKAEQALVESDKDLEEHRYVIDMIVDGLAPMCSAIEVDSQPSVCRLANVSHLQTSITARLKGESSLAGVVDALHPTPAVCGVPRDRARALIADLEGYDRGLYAGTFGWLDAAGNGEFDVALRCGLIDGHQALLFAGAGITADSEVEVEWHETSQKFEAFQGAITEGER